MGKNYLKSDERKATTIDSVVELAGEQNPSTITTSQIAKKMGVTQGALFRHFATKDALWEAVIDTVSQRLLSRVESVAAREESALSALRAMFTAHVAFVGAHPGVPRMLFGELQRKEDTAAKKVVRRFMHRYAVVVEMQVKRGQATHEIDADVEPALVAGMFIGTIQGLVMQAMLGDDTESLSSTAEPTFDLIERALRTTGS